MPRAQEYRDGASLLRQRSAAFADAAVSYRSARNPEWASGPIADAHRESMEALATHLAAGSVRLTELALVCERRAVICDAYAARVRDWEQLSTWDRLLTRPPARPAPWADA